MFKPGLPLKRKRENQVAATEAKVQILSNPSGSRSIKETKVWNLFFFATGF